MRLKTGVRVFGLRSEIILALMIAEGIWQKYSAELVITGGIEGKHSRGSIHYSGGAVDLRTRELSDAKMATDELRSALGDDYDVILESDHCHVEFQPKGYYG